MGINKVLIYIITGLILSGCAQSTAMIGNISQAGVSYITNKAVKEETGMDTVTFVSKKIEEKQSETKIRRDFKKLVETNFEKTREKLISQDQSNIFN